MSEIHIYLESLKESFSNSDKDEAKRIVSQIHSLFKAENLTQLEIDSSITALLKTSHNKCTILDLLLSYFMKSNYKDALSNIFQLLSDLIANYENKLDVYIDDIIPVCLKVLRSSCSADVKLKSLLPLSAIVCNNKWSQHMPPIANLTLDQIVFKKNTPNVMNRQLFLLGKLCEKHPEIMTQYSDKICSTLMKLATEDINSLKIILTAKEGMFAAINGYMTMADLNEENIGKVYRCIKMFSDPRDMTRKAFARGAISLLSSKTGKPFAEHVCTDLKYWLQVLIKYVSSSNADDRSVGCFGLSRAYQYVGDTLMAKGSCEYSINRLKYLNKYFKEIISNSPENKELEYKLALEGFAVVVSKCRYLIGDNEFTKVTEVLVQRAKLVLRNEDANVEDENAEEHYVERMKKMCMYINALASLGFGVEECLVDLIKVLISEYPKCPINERAHSLTTINRNIFLVDIKILIPFIVRESCKRSISISLQYNSGWKGSRNRHSWTYENFVDLWKSLLTAHRGEDVFQIYMEHFIKTIPNLDFTTKASSSDSTADVTREFEEMEVPNNFLEYSFFVNLCDLTSTIFDLFVSDELPVEWSHSWLHRVLCIVEEGLKKNPLASSLLKIGQSTLMTAKKLHVFSHNDDAGADITSQLMELFKILSINNASGFHQLRSALFILQTPHQILNEFVLKLAADAFEVVLRNGRNYLDLISEAMDILNDWDSSIDRDSFRPLCVKLLPSLNDYLCSTGISDEKILEADRSVASRYEFATRRRRVLLTQGTNQQLEMVQHKIMRFLGKMDSDTLQCLLLKSEDQDTTEALANDDKEDIQLCDLSEKLKISLPCPEQRKIDIYLDSLVPRIKELSLNSTNRDTRVTACQVLHSIVLLVYGTHHTLPLSVKGSLTNVISELTAVMLILAADTDVTIKDMFDPLLTESCHWFTSPVNSSSAETEKFLLALMNGASHPSDSLVREKSCLALKEVVKWSIKQSSDAELRRGPPGVAAILRSVCQGIVHPNDYKKRGAFLIFKNVASQVYQIDSIIDKFLPEILHLTVFCINIAHTTMEHQFAIYRQDATEALQLVLKCLQSKATLFKKYNKNRRTPKGFEKSLLKDICLWMLKQLKDCNCRSTAKKLFKTLTIISKQLDQYTDLENLIKDLNNFTNFNAVYLEPDCSIDSSTFVESSSHLNVTNTLMNHISCIDCHLCLKEIVQIDLKSPKLLISFKFLLSLNRDEILSVSNKTMTPSKCDIVENLLFQLYWKMYEILSNELKDELIEQMCSSIVVWCLDYELWKIMNRNNSSILSIKDLFTNMKRNFSADKWELLVKNCENFTKPNLIEIFENYTAPTVIANSYLKKYLDDLVAFYKILNVQRLFVNLKRYDLLNIFKEIFINSSNKNTTDLHKSLINFILNCDLLKASDVLSTLLNPSNDPSKITSFLQVFKDQVNVYLVDHYVDILSCLEDRHDCNMSVVTMALKYSSEAKSVDENFMRYLTNWIIKIWPKLVAEHTFDSLLEYFTLLAVALPVHMDSLYSAHSMRSWLVRELKNPERKIEKKNKLVYLLAAVYKPSEDTIVDDDLTQALSVVTSHFPLRSNEFPAGSPERERYLSTFKALLETMANSGSFAIFKVVVNTSSVDKKHICDRQIEHKLVSLMERLSPHQSFIILDWVYAKFLSKSYDPSVRLNLLTRFLIPMLNGASIDSLELFYGSHIPVMLEKLDREISTVICSEFALKHLFLDWNSSFLLAEVIFSKIPDTIVETLESRIESNNKKLKLLFCQKCTKIRNVSVPSCENQTDVVEYLRISRCSAYKCLYCIVMASWDDKDLTKTVARYGLLISNSKDSLLWEGMIDLNKQYVFPLDQVCSLKYHTVKSKKTSDNVSFYFDQSILSQSLVGGVLKSEEERRKMIFSQTLQDDILKYDLNMATTRDAPTVVTYNPQDRVVLQMEDTDLLNHEIIATVCCIMKDMDKLTSPSEEEQCEIITPSWIQHLVAILSDRRRPSNVKLFLSQVMVKLRDNDRDIFRKYGKLLLKPLLGIVHDRCTSFTPGDNLFNFWDLGIILMLLSWRDVAVPSTVEEINSANYVLEILIQQINPNTQSTDLFKHSLELLKDIFNVWGKYLTVPSDVLIQKLQNQAEKLFTAGIQITAVVLASGCKPWNSVTQFEVISRIFFKFLDSDDNKTYKSSAEVSGLMLQALYEMSISNDDVDMESGDYSKYLSFRDTVRNKIHIFKRDRGKFIICLCMIRRYHAQFCDDSLMNVIVYLVPKSPIHTKKMCFRIYLSAIDFLDPQWLQDSLVNMDIKLYVKDKDLGVDSLHIINKLITKIGLSYVRGYLEVVCSLGSHKSSDVRGIVYEILMKAFDLFSDEKINLDNKKSADISLLPSDSNRKRHFDNTLQDPTQSDVSAPDLIESSVKAVLLLGMEDEEDDLRSRVCGFWTEKLNNNLQERWLHIISELCVDEKTSNQGCEMERAVRLLFEVCKKAPDYESTKLFNNPLEDCAFMEYNLNGKRPKQTSLLAPMFAETINSHRQLSSLVESLQTGDVRKAEIIASQMHSRLSMSNTTLLNKEQFLLRSTLDSVTSGLSIESFERSLPSTSRQNNTMSESFSLQEESSLLFTMEAPLLHRKTYKPLSDQRQGDVKKDTILTSEYKLRRRLISNKNLQKSKFAAIAMEKKIRTEQKRLAEKPAPIFREFRKGDYPDIQINLDNVVAPMLGLAARDPIFSKDLFIVLFKSLLSHCSEDVANTFKRTTANFILSRLKSRSIPLTVEALLEVCRICLKNGTTDSKDTIMEVSKNNALDWLGQLLLDELTMDQETTSRKRAKLEEGAASVAGLPASIRSSIRSLKWENQWDMLQNLYGEATTKEDIGHMDKLHCTEEYFNCFARLSDWNGLMEKLKDHLAPDSYLEDDSCVDTAFDMNLVWGSNRMKDTYLPLMFMAHIQMRAIVDCVYKFNKTSKVERDRLKGDIEMFTKNINTWMDAPDKNSILEGRLSPYLCLWRVISSDHGVEGCDSALKWLRQEWSRECSGSTHTGLQTTLDFIRNISETRNYLDLMLKLRGNTSNNDAVSQAIYTTQYSWGQCVPRQHDDTVAWDLRLACRSIYTCQIQNYIKHLIEDDEEDVENLQHREVFSKIQRRAELHLLKTALHQNNYQLSKRIIDKHSKNSDDFDDDLSWNLEEIKFMKLAAKRETNVGTKISLILNSWIKGDYIKNSQNSVVDCRDFVGVLEVLSELSDMLCCVLTQHPWADCVPHLKTHKHALNAFLMDRTDGLQKEEMVLNLIKFSSVCLVKCVDAVEQDNFENVANKSQKLTIKDVQEHRQLQFRAETYMKLARYSRKAKQDYLKDESHEDLLKLSIIGILKGMRFGHMEARKLFPVLLLDLADLPKEHSLVQLFKNEVLKVPSWMFLSWSAQLMAHLPSQRSTLSPLLVKIAQQYPSALRHHYELSKVMWKKIPDMKGVMNELDKLLHDSQTSLLVQAIGSLRCPWTSLISYIELFYEENCDKAKLLTDLKADLLMDDRSALDMKIRGQVFDEVKGCIQTLEAVKNMEYGKELSKILEDAKETCTDGQKTLPERTNLLRFSPYLENYRKNLSDEGIEVFGQYNSFQNTPPDPKNHVTIVKFHSEVSIYKASMRRPIRMSLYASNGKKYSFLVKSSEDLRQDNRIQQILELMNHPLGHISMHIETYKVFPLTQSFGLIEFVKSCATLGNIITHSRREVQAMLTGVKRVAKKEPVSKCKCSLKKKKKIEDIYGMLAAPENMTGNIGEYQEKVSSISKYYLRESIQKIAITSEMFVKMKSNFIKTLAPMSIAHWILGIGDRHLSNCMISLNTGNVIGIDFGHAFGTATQELAVPELMPFRFTPQMQGFVGASNDEISELMWQSLNKLCDHRSLLVAAMEVFVREPTLNWIKETNRDQWKPRHKIDQCKRKLNGIDPITIILEDLQNRTVGAIHIFNYCQIVRHVATEQKHLSVDQQVERLIKLATDDGIMSVTWAGWNPYF